MPESSCADPARVESPSAPRARHVCPWWLGYVLASPLRRLIEPPEPLLSPFVRPGMTVVEPGCGMGFFSIPLARMVGPTGTLVCVDLQPRMIRALLARARRAGVADRIRAQVCTGGDLGLSPMAESADLAVAIHMLHEVPDQRGLLAQLRAVLRPGGRLLVVEPKGHVTPADFGQSLEWAREAGFSPVDDAPVGRGLSAILGVRS